MKTRSMGEEVGELLGFKNLAGCQCEALLYPHGVRDVVIGMFIRRMLHLACFSAVCSVANKAIF